MGINSYHILLVILLSLLTAFSRLAPFLIFAGKRPVPKTIRVLGSLLPSAVVGMLVVYCFRNLNLTAKPYGAPEAVAIITIFIVQKFRKNTALSIAVGTAAYMILVQSVFV